jgi:glutamate dehydrogenase
MRAQVTSEAMPEIGAGEEARLDTVQAAARVAASATCLGGDPQLSVFLTAFMHNAPPEDIVTYSAAELAHLVRRVFERCARRSPGQPLIAVFDPWGDDPQFAGRSETIVLAVNDDMPFLYDSCTAEVFAHGAEIVAAFHPVIATARDERGERVLGGETRPESVIVLALSGTVESQEAERIRGGLLKVFIDVCAAVRDWRPMLARLAETVAKLKQNPPSVTDAELQENLAFLGWLADNHFTFLGSREYRFGAAGEGQLDPVFDSGLGVLTNPEARVIRRGPDRSSLSPEVRAFLTEPAPLIITKSSARSSVHRRVHMDYVGVKTFDAAGNLIGERRFVGLFTSTAYSELASKIPLLRRKIAHVLERSGLKPASHDGKALAHILDAFPRDELFQISEDELLETAVGILNLGERARVRLFLRFDKFDRFVSALVFIPRERYSGAVRVKIHGILARAFDGRMSAATPMLDDEILARIHYIVGRNTGARPDADPKALEAEIRAAIRNWEDGFEETLEATRGRGAREALRRYRMAFPASYRDSFTPAEAVDDIGRIERVLASDRPVFAHVYGRDGDSPDTLRLKLFVRGDYVALSECLPVFENLGLKVIAEDAFLLAPFTAQGSQANVALQNFLMRTADGSAVNIAGTKPLIEEAFHAVWAGEAESDGFNRLVLTPGIDWRNIVILRAVAKFLRQAGIPFSQPYVESALTRNRAIATRLVELFHTRFDPESFADLKTRMQAAAAIRAAIETALNDVPSADDDRIVRLILATIEAMVRTSFYQNDAGGCAKSFLAFKLESRSLDILPAPRPLYEIFVYAPSVEGVHLRFGKVARGGIRWSDRAEDFRTEILGLVKAQQVKNAVIVPVGAKGGFYPKAVPAQPSRETMQAVGVAAYKLFIGALLDLTDNVGPDGVTVHPKNVVRYDDDDPYLVVAADKGTATFSDIANAIALERGYWLGDAFASGGSHGYDHKKMGITARGAWEAVKRHFRELGRDCQTETFTCVGVGDMSGDVFGNAMLQSQATKLLAAFDHRHIFIDPDPDPRRAHGERKRLFELPRSSWADYDPSLISRGGGVFPRTMKEIPLSLEMMLLAGVRKDRMSPTELIHALLSAPVDLLFFGGIGTYIKASTENNLEVGDRANDSLRLNGADVRAAIVGEGANLGTTQLGRIEYARAGGPDRKGGRIDTDAIDNSAGVDTSDHEVNIKILMSGPLRRGELTPEERDSLLSFMTEDVAHLVLKDNYDQTFALSVAELSAPRDADAASRFMRELERRGELDRVVEALPADEAIRAAARSGRGLTRPEIAVLLAYAKLDLSRAVIESELPDDPYFDRLLESYFPPLAANQFKAELPRHRLAREISATQLVNRTVNLAGPLFAHRMRELSNAPLAMGARGYALAEGVFGLEALAARIASLDLKVVAAIQNAMMAEIADSLRRLGLWFIVQVPQGAPLEPTIATYRAGFQALKGRFSVLISALEKAAVEGRIATLKEAGIPDEIAEDVALLPLLAAIPEIVLLAQRRSLPAQPAAGAYFAMGGAVGIDRLRVLAAAVPALDHWDRLALRRIVDDLYGAQRQLADLALGTEPAETAESGVAAVTAWAAAHEDEIGRTLGFLAELEGAAPSVAKLSLANSRIQKMASGSGA